MNVRDAIARHRRGVPLASSHISSISALPGLQWWVEPDGIVATDAVDAWTDGSGNGNDVSESGANRPTVEVGALDGFDGVKCVRASSQRLKRVNSPLMSTAFTIGVVMRVDASNNAQQFVGNAVAGSNGLEFFQNSASYSMSLAGVASQNGNAVSTGAFHIFVYACPGPDATGAYRYDRAPTTMAFATGMTAPGATASLILGARANLTDHADATYVAAFLCDEFLSVRQMEAAENYWKDKYPSLA